MSLVLVCVFLSLIIGGCSPTQNSTEKEEEIPLSPTKIQLGEVVCLTTYWYPKTSHNDDGTENRIVRELVRQGVLLAVREELGLVTRDETLGEPFPDIPSENGASDKHTAKPLELWLELDEDGSWETRLYGAGSEYKNPVWRHEGKVEFNVRTIYSQFAEQMADMSAEIANQLRAAGAKGDAAQLNPANVPGEEIEKLLGEMNFVSQFSAVRAAHHEMKKEGTSLKWIGVLVRGYAHLALLTDHTWASHSEAFAARSLLYVERMMQLDNVSRMAQWHRAYALAVIGAHGAALDQLSELQKDNAGESEEEAMAWTKLIAPYVKFEHDALDAVAIEHVELAETVAILQWELFKTYQLERWIYEEGINATQECPEAYGVYSTMANCNALKIMRVGSGHGMAAFAELLPKRIGTVDDLPEEIKPLTVQRDGLLSKLLGTKPDLNLSTRPIKISKTLLESTESEVVPSECSWGILGQLIAEEQFIEAVDLLELSGAGVEYSKADLVDRLLPLVENHRYAPYINSFAFTPYEKEQSDQTLRKLKVVDPKGNMNRFYKAFWQVPTVDGMKGNLFAWTALWSRNFTLSGMCESYYGCVNAFSSSLSKENWETFAKDFLEISPYSPNATRVQMEIETAYDVTQLQKWEGKIKDDPVAWNALGDRYYRTSDFDASVRCYQRSLEISPTMAATQGLAYSYYYDGKKELWQSALEAFLKVEDLSTHHAQIHSWIAHENILNRNWALAESHALAAAQSYSASGLKSISHVYEGMSDWEKSEHFIAESTRKYPSHQPGTNWYFWCRRTGRGDLDTARKFAIRNIEIASRSRKLDDVNRVLTYRLLEEELEASLTGFDQQLATCPESREVWDTLWRKFQVIGVCGDIKDSERQASTIQETRTVVAEQIAKTYPRWVEVLEGLCDAYEGEELSEEYLKNFDDVLAETIPNHRCSYQYFLGIALDQKGKTELADLYFRKAAFGGPFDCYNATLAGHRLVERHGPDRGGLPEEFAKIEAEHAAKAELKAQEEAEGTIQRGRESLFQKDYRGRDRRCRRPPAQIRT